MGLPQLQAEAEGSSFLQQQQNWTAEPDGDGDHLSTSASLLRGVRGLGHQQSSGRPTGVQATASLHIQVTSAAAAAPPPQPEQGEKPAPRWLAIHRAVWSSGVLCVLLAALIFAVAALLVKLTGGRVPVLEITLIRSAISLVVSAALIKGKHITPVMGHKQNIKWLIPRGVFGATAMTTFYAAILLLPLADGMTLFFLNPCLTAVAAWALRGEPLGLLGFAGCLCSLLGMVVLIHPPMIFGGHASWGPRRIWGTGFGLVSAVCCAGAFISIRYIGKSEPAIVVALYFHLSTALLSGLPLALSWPQAPLMLGWFDALMLVGVAAGSFGGQLFMTRALQLENASLISSLNFSQVLYSYLFGIAFFSEHLTLFGVLGSILVAIGMLCVTVRPKDSSSASLEAPPVQRSLSSVMSDQLSRLDSFKRLLSRARADAEAEACAGSDHLQQQRLAERMPLRTADAPDSLTTGQQDVGNAAQPVQQHSWAAGKQQDAEQQQQQQQTMADVGVQLHPWQQRQQQRDQAVPLVDEGFGSSVEVFEGGHSMHHRHPAFGPAEYGRLPQQVDSRQGLQQPPAPVQGDVLLPLQHEPAS